ncbi:MAG: hypothetical protein A3H72_02975 [Candidatus Doudnabacteria bacterium RIFCSPLOWO2_02_FULL_48_8]|uniref:Peptidoglycan binding domain-containing protein n=1 Tax=Candidatus Doudnabacteria bacterium RIFCSPHIGHO2_01_FULL_46_24 TaxID=1817825 RepID=A0A1F5NTA1_9BACT|nr:MAG: hypothetical protein A2720_04570 [Candidatus Doudnabacteria bacterium RIFCSPHIGHO2_01_FULL_46_24]OGE95264.1 MAG: hypothetical protein A3H72_02975 [Candidatus Doudnabacteria bacterium RIFCSPLOWO2_02_FULL_48_8]
MSKLLLSSIIFASLLLTAHKAAAGTNDAVSMRNWGAVQTAKLVLLNQAPPAPPLLDPEELSQIEAVVAETNQKSASAKLVIENGRAVEFERGQNGQSVDVYALSQLLIKQAGLAFVPMFVSQPAVNLADTNSLGIAELVAVGESDFSGSPKNRIHNIKVGSAKYNGIIIQPSQEFSFNKFLGDVDAENGFLPELVIKRTGVVPEFGGGLCQVSSTAFRAAMNAGLPIVERRNHSFAVKYYAPQGTDATIYPGSTDLRFTNNLSSHLLIWTRIEGYKLYYDFYGTKDDRLVEFDGPTQYDKKADGSMKAIWTRHVSLNGQQSEQIFKSTYLPPALFHPEEQATTPNPQTPPEPAETTQPTPNEQP